MPASARACEPHINPLCTHQLFSDLRYLLKNRIMTKDRRSFLKSSSYAMAGLGLSTMINWDAIAAAKKLVGANGKINIGAIGINGMGWADLTSLLKIPDTQVIALCD